MKAVYLIIGREQPEAADRYFRRLREKAERLKDHPRIGERHPEIFRSACMLIEAPYVILYKAMPDSEEGDIHTVEIMRMVDGRRDLVALF